MSHLFKSVQQNLKFEVRIPRFNANIQGGQKALRIVLILSRIQANDIFRGSLFNNFVFCFVDILETQACDPDFCVSISFGPSIAMNTKLHLIQYSFNSALHK